MHAHLENQFSCTIQAWAEPSDDGLRFQAVQFGRVLIADSERGLLHALAEGLALSRPSWSIAA